jgi:hypothetical protein
MKPLDGTVFVCTNKKFVKVNKTHDKFCRFMASPRFLFYFIFQFTSGIKW